MLWSWYCSSVMSLYRCIWILEKFLINISLSLLKDYVDIKLSLCQKRSLSFVVCWIRAYKMCILDNKLKLNYVIIELMVFGLRIYCTRRYKFFPVRILGIVLELKNVVKMWEHMVWYRLIYWNMLKPFAIDRKRFWHHLTQLERIMATNSSLKVFFLSL